MWQKKLDADATISTEWESPAPFVIRIEGATGQTFELQSSRQGEDDFNVSEPIYQNPMLFRSFPDTDYRIVASAAGATAFINEVFTSRTDRTMGR